MPPANRNPGVVRWAVGRDDGVIYAEAYYDETVGDPENPETQPVVDKTGLNEQGQTRNRALRVWSTFPDEREVSVVDGTGQRVTVTLPPGTGLTIPIETRTANQLAVWGITTRADLNRIEIYIR